MRAEAALAALRDLADEMAEGQLGPSDVRDALWTLCACKMAVKANDRLGLAEMERLIWDLAETENPYLCPHGRPITILLERGDLHRKFKR
jgi:DNA mismatch repair protein MutL